jgi:hypothetical protein
MKKVLSILLAVVLLSALSESAFCRDKKGNQAQKPVIGNWSCGNKYNLCKCY